VALPLICGSHRLARSKGLIGASVTKVIKPRLRLILSTILHARLEKQNDIRAGGWALPLSDFGSSIHQLSRRL
jgi:hypothetical protein